MKVGIWGLGVEGRANRARAVAEGAQVVEVDAAEGPDGLAALSECQVVVRSPGISRYAPESQALVRAGSTVTGGMALWLGGLDPTSAVAVTGTKGKSTTTALLAHLLSGLGVRAAAGGNLGRVPWEPGAEEGIDRWVVEISSFQASDLTVAPRVVVVTSLSPDHLDWHGSYGTYVADKLSICTRPGAAVTVAADTPELRSHEELLGPRVRWVGRPGSGERAWWGPSGLRGAHNVMNAELARAALAEMDGGSLAGVAADLDRLEDLVAGFVPLPSRLQTVWTADGVEFVDDSLSTTPMAAIAALETFGGRRVALLVGGHDRGIDYRPLGHYLAERLSAARGGSGSAKTGPAEPGSAEPGPCGVCLVAIPDNGSEIVRQVAEMAPGVKVLVAADLEEGTRLAFEWARPDGVVLLSPAAASFGRFRDYQDRAQAFTRAASAGGDDGRPAVDLVPQTQPTPTPSRTSSPPVA
ncbi:MAG: UDP-N-acetylmuramoyl-L-alanine--D-glutamate ligase [Acidimicrobiales bacterium]